MIFREREFVELKSEVVSDICKEVIAFANKEGGTIYRGGCFYREVVSCFV